MSLKYGEIIKQMSLEEKALMMSGKNTWETVDFEKYGIPSMAMSDGPHGLRRQAGAGDFLLWKLSEHTHQHDITVTTILAYK